MTRTLAFDYPKALERGTWLFWKTGYAGTALRDLLKKMGIGESSFYNTLKSKKQAYLECLKHYNATVGRERGEALLSAPTAALGIRALFKTVFDCLDDPKTPARACMMADSMAREVLDEPDLRKYVQTQLSMGSVAMTTRLTADKKAGLLPKSFNPELMTSIIITYLQGMFRMALVSYDRTLFERQVDVFLESLGI